MKPPEDEGLAENPFKKNREFAERTERIIQERFPGDPPPNTDIRSVKFRNIRTPNLLVEVAEGFSKDALTDDSFLGLKKEFDFPTFSLVDSREVFNPNRRIRMGSVNLPDHFIGSDGNGYYVYEMYFYTKGGEGLRLVAVRNLEKQYLPSGVPQVDYAPQDNHYEAQDFELTADDDEKIEALLSGMESGQFQAEQIYQNSDYKD